MKIDFLNNSYKEVPRTDSQFGLCDDQTGLKAYSDIIDSTKWVATVNNVSSIKTTFTPVDKCLIKDHELPGIGRCDGILTTEKHLYFIELKNKNREWISHAKKQLEDTIILFNENHDIQQFKHKRAFACNKARPHFHEINNEENMRFFREYGVRLDIQASIIII